jgi:hypothetical protein
MAEAVGERLCIGVTLRCQVSRDLINRVSYNPLRHERN